MHLVEERDEREERRKKGKGLKFYALISFTLAVAIVVLGTGLLTYVQRIEVTGNSYVSEAEITDWIKKDKFAFNSLYLLWKYNVRESKLPPSLEDMSVGLKNPWTLSVRVYEKKMVGFLYYGDSYVYFDKDGVALSQTNQYMEGIPGIEGIEVDKVKIGAKLPVEEKRVFKNILSVTQELKRRELSPNRIVCDGAKIQIYFEGVCVNLGSSGFGIKIAQLPSILPSVQGQSGTLQMERYTENSAMISFEKN